MADLLLSVQIVGLQRYSSSSTILAMERFAQMQKNSYDFDQFEDNATEAKRLATRARQGLGHFITTLRQNGLQPTMRVLDVGFGTGERALAIARFVRSGEVVGVDRSHDLLVCARELSKRRKQQNVSFAAGDVLEPESLRKLGRFDFIHMRLVIQHLLTPVEALLNLRALLRIGGTLFLEDTDRAWMTVVPSIPASAPASPIGSGAPLRREAPRASLSRGLFEPLPHAFSAAHLTHHRWPCKNTASTENHGMFGARSTVSQQPNSTQPDDSEGGSNLKQVAVRLLRRLYQKLQEEADQRSEYLASTVRRYLTEASRQSWERPLLDRIERKIDALPSLVPGSSSSDLVGAVSEMAETMVEMESRLAEMAAATTRMNADLASLLGVYRDIIAQLNAVLKRMGF